MRRAAFLLLVAFGLGCRPASAPPPSTAPAPAPLASETEALMKVARVHGGAGPWAVLGYRMGIFALGKLDLPEGSFDLDVRHESPKTPQFACIADGAQAATGASLGKVNLSLAETDEAHIQTTYRKKSSGQSLTLRPAKVFRERFADVPREKLREAGKTVLSLPDAELFEAVESGAK